MTDETINILPEKRRQQEAQAYFVRLGILFLVLVTAITIIAGILLLPTYAYVTQNLRAKQEYAASLAPNEATNTPDISARINVLARKVAVLTPLASNTSASKAVRMLLAVPRPGVTLQNINFTLGAGAKPSVLLVSGIASTRSGLQAYQQALEQAPFVRAAEVPVSVFAKDAQVPFTITVTLTP